jgi:hypothetical protein
LAIHEIDRGCGDASIGEIALAQLDAVLPGGEFNEIDADQLLGAAAEFRQGGRGAAAAGVEQRGVEL